MKARNTMLKMRVIITCVLLLVAHAAQAAVIHLPGNTVDFYYDNTLLDPAFGTLTAVGDSIFALPTGFKAESINGSIDTFSVSGTVTVVVKAGYQFEAAAVQQLGDYQLNGDATATVASDLTVADSSNAATSETTTMINSGLGTNDNLLHEWSSLGQFDLSTVTWDSVTSIDLSLDTLLTASTTASGDYALIQSKQVAGGLVTIVTTEVPLPASLWLFVSGFLGLLSVVRRKH